MKKFIQKILIFAAIIIIGKLISFTIIMIYAPGESKNYIGENSNNKPKIILVGSSNLNHNYDYKLLNKKFTNYDVIGCNLNEPSGLYLTVNKLKQLNINSNDIIVLCFPHSFYEEQKLLPLETYKKRGFSFNILTKFVSDFPLYFMNKVTTLKIYDSYTFMRNIGKRRKRNNKKDKSQNIFFEEFPRLQSKEEYKNCWTNNKKNKFGITSISFEKEYIEQMYEYLSTTLKGKVLFRFPAVHKNDYTLNTERLAFLKKQYPFINDFESSIYEHEYWYNLWYHLNKCGRDLSTEKLILELNKQGIKE